MRNIFLKPTKLMQLVNAGRMVLNNSKGLIEIIIQGEIIELPYKLIKPNEWGFIYEKYVGQIKEDNGFQIKYVGLVKGVLDGGIDLIAANEYEIQFIQCKYGSKKIGKQGVENILYQANNFILKQPPQKSKVKFVLCINDINNRLTPKNKNYFLSKNNNPFGVKIEIEEFKMELTNGNKS